MIIRKKTFILIITYFTAALVALGAYACVQSIEGTSYRRTAEYGYEHAFSEVVLAVGDLDTALKKASFAKGREISMSLCGDIYSSCLAAEMTMATLPFSSYELEKTASFIGVCGDYAASLLKSCAESGFGDTERENMSALSEISDGLKTELYALQSDVNNGDVALDAPEKLIQKDDGEALLSVRMKANEATLGELPELSYDGVYAVSETAAVKKPVSEEDAKAAAESFTGRSELKTELRYEDGSLCISFDGGTVTVNAEGKVTALSSERFVAGDIDDETLIKAAKEKLRALGFGNMRLMSSYRVDSVLTLGFAPVTDGGMLLRNAQVRLSMAADDASLYAYNASDYYENMESDGDLTPSVTKETAQNALPDAVTVTDCVLELCPTESSSRLCYDFSVTDETGKELHILVDAVTGHQFDIVL